MIVNQYFCCYVGHCNPPHYYKPSVPFNMTVVHWLNIETGSLYYFHPPTGYWKFRDFIDDNTCVEHTLWSRIINLRALWVDIAPKEERV
jgi:hypothetical protein